LVLAYNCPDGCADSVAALEQLRLRAKKDAAGKARAVLVPDPELPKRFAAVVAGWSWVGDTLQEEAITCIAAKQDTEAPEAHIGCWD
jgi:hypothetical protein